MISPADAPKRIVPSGGMPSMPRHTPGLSDASAHTPGTHKGEERVHEEGREPGRDDPRAARVARDSTAISASHMEPIDPRMPHIPPA